MVPGLHTGRGGSGSIPRSYPNLPGGVPGLTGSPEGQWSDVTDLGLRGARDVVLRGSNRSRCTESLYEQREVEVFSVGAKGDLNNHGADGPLRDPRSDCHADLGQPRWCEVSRNL